MGRTIIVWFCSSYNCHWQEVPLLIEQLDSPDGDTLNGGEKLKELRSDTSLGEPSATRVAVRSSTVDQSLPRWRSTSAGVLTETCDMHHRRQNYCSQTRFLITATLWTSKRETLSVFDSQTTEIPTIFLSYVPGQPQRTLHDNS